MAEEEITSFVQMYFDNDLGETIDNMLPYDKEEMFESIVTAFKDGEIDSGELY